MSLNAKRMVDAIQRVIDLADHDWKAWDEGFEGLPPEHRSLPDRMYPQWFEAMMTSDLEQQAVRGIIGWTAPDGRPLMGVSGWLLALGTVVEGGRHEIGRYNRVSWQQREGVVR